MTNDVQVKVKTDRATQDEISYKDYWEIYHFELRKWDDSMARRDNKKSPDGKVLLGDYHQGSLDDFCTQYSPDMSKAMWSKIHKALREYLDALEIANDDRVAAEDRTAAAATLPALEAEVAKVLTRRARNILRRNTSQPELPMSVEQALADVDPDAKVVEIGEGQPPRHVLLISTSQPVDIHVNGTVTATTATATTPARPEPKRERPKLIRPLAKPEQDQRRQQLRTKPSWHDVIERGLRSYKEEEDAQPNA